MSPEKKKKEVMINARIPLELKKRVDSYCEKEGMKIKAVIAKALDEYLKSKGA